MSDPKYTLQNVYFFVFFFDVFYGHFMIWFVGVVFMAMTFTMKGDSPK